MAYHGTREYQGLQRVMRLGAVMALALALNGVVGAGTLSNQAGLAFTNNPVGSNASVPTALDSSRMINAFLDLNQERCREALVRTRRWLDTLEVNPADLRARGIKGKKKLAELLDVYLRLYDLAPADDKKALMERIRGITAITATPGYHDMLSVTDQ